jgi:hypothetical protein
VASVPLTIRSHGVKANTASNVPYLPYVSPVWSQEYAGMCEKGKPGTAWKALCNPTQSCATSWRCSGWCGPSSSQIASKADCMFEPLDSGQIWSQSKATYIIQLRKPAECLWSVTIIYLVYWSVVICLYVRFEAFTANKGATSKTSSDQTAISMLS